MSTNRAALLTKLHKVLKKHYKPVSPPKDRTVLEHLLYACCLENARPEAADDYTIGKNRETGPRLGRWGRIDYLTPLAMPGALGVQVGGTVF